MKRRDLLKAIPALLTVPSASTEADAKEVPVDLEKVECAVKYEHIDGFHIGRRDCSFLLCPDCGRKIKAVNGRRWPIVMECSHCEIRLIKASVASSEARSDGTGEVKVEYYKHKILQPNVSD